MELEDYLGILGFLLAAFSLVQSLIRKAKIILVAGPSFEVYYKPDGATGIYMPIAFVNEGEIPGKIISVYIKLTPPAKNPNFQMRWNQFVKHDNKNRGFEHLNYCFAFSVPEQSVIDKFVYFLWDSAQAQKLEFVEGEYQMEVLLDQSTSPGEYNKFKFSFNICQEDIVFFGTNEAMNLGHTRKITIKNYEAENILIQNDGH